MTYSLKKNENGYYLIDLKDKDSMHLYYGIKERFEYQLDDKQAFIKKIALSLKEHITGYDWIAIPESSSPFLIQLLTEMNNEFFIIRKNNIQNVLEFFETLPLQKKEKISHLERLNAMENVFKINLMKANQRRKYDSVIFEKQPLINGSGLVIDDSLFSGTTLAGLKSVLPKFDFIAIFSK